MLFHALLFPAAVEIWFAFFHVFQNSLAFLTTERQLLLRELAPSNLYGIAASAIICHTPFRFSLSLPALNQCLQLFPEGDKKKNRNRHSQEIGNRRCPYNAIDTL